MQEVIGSIPFTSTIRLAEEFEDTSFFRSWLDIFCLITALVPDPIV
jgi:hypothetical protein